MATHDSGAFDVVDREGLVGGPLEVVDMIESLSQADQWSARSNSCIRKPEDNDRSIPLKLTNKFLVLGPGATKCVGDIVNESPNSEEITDRESE